MPLGNFSSLVPLCVFVVQGFLRMYWAKKILVSL